MLDVFMRFGWGKKVCLILFLWYGMPGAGSEGEKKACTNPVSLLTL